MDELNPIMLMILKKSDKLLNKQNWKLHAK